ncbi:10-formyltetrahydrofolate:L-methionyl-tRNA(fMet) N-formyltransferase [[Clostridium] ultunense Esp]|uniref:Methionyl-tRNA formyltransferase n=1 Tax=[Clostridium] ultunense Esp TaxID=1288971 RepID=M1ZC35_9FIRM|nr:methionyl-tRNA formyltransferase [Schnuerera ultunensis]CCQ96056.1 10-formyltetrahydrofolate:L-methionyl-tRNA(fMet) N-formyltransferase [[Clostridium] ultunense Esp]SHD76949.1 methionyl-tRNA formyltransferase [[Clostridium] ultunense Esp]
MRVVFMGTPEFAVPSLEALNKNGYHIPLVITQKDRPRGRGKKVHPTPVKARALGLGLEVYQPDSVNSTESINRLREISPDCIVVVAYGQILKKDVFNLPQYGCLNIHASLLPKYRGAAPINWAIINGERETGVTIIKMDEGLDTGDMLKYESIPIAEEDDSESIHDKLSQLGGSLIVETLKDIKKGNITSIPQSDELSTYAPKISKEIGKIDWNENGDNIINLVRGLKPWPSAYMVYKGKKVKIHKAKKIEKFSHQDNGVIIKVSDDGIYVNCSDSCIVIEELQFPGKKKLNVSEYLRGNQLDSNIRLG